MATRLLTLREVMGMTSLSRSAVYALMAETIGVQQSPQSYETEGKFTNEGHERIRNVADQERRAAAHATEVQFLDGGHVAVGVGQVVLFSCPCRRPVISLLDYKVGAIAP